MTKLTRRTMLAGLSAVTVAPAFAQSGRSITMMHGFTPGANVDLVARLVADGLEQAPRPAVRGRAASGRRRHHLGRGGRARSAGRQHA